MKKILVPILILAFAIIGCKEKSANQVLFDEVMVIHDDVMPRMSDMHKLKKKLGRSLSETSDSTEVFELIKQLDVADEAMMTWMSDFGDGYKSKVEGEKKEYLLDQKELISEVRDLMLKSIEDAEQHLKESK